MILDFIDKGGIFGEIAVIDIPMPGTLRATAGDPGNARNRSL
jgi:hypothetical protein